MYGGASTTDLSNPDAFRLILNNVPVRLIVLSATLEIIAATDLLLLTTRLLRDDILGRNLFDVFPVLPNSPKKNGLSMLRKSLQHVLETRTAHTMGVQRYDLPSPHPEEGFQIRYWVSSNTPILDESGNVRMIIHCSEDVSEIVELKIAQGEWEVAEKGFQGRSEEMEAKFTRQTAEATVLATQRLLDKAMTQARDLLMQGRTEEMVAEMTRREDIATGLADQRVVDLAENEAKDLVMQGRSDELKAEMTRRADIAVGLADQKVRDRASYTAREHRLHEEAEQKFKSLLEIAPDATVIIDRSGTIMLNNDQSEKLFGYSSEALIGQTVDLLMPVGYRPQDTENVAKFFMEPQNQVPGVVIELVGRKRDRTEFPFEATIRPLNTVDGALTILAMRDLTERNKLNAQLVRAQRLESIGTFAGNIAHDLNNALAPVLMSMDLLRVQNPSSSKLINTMESAANRGVEMLRQLLVFSKGSYIEPKRVDTVAMLEEIQEVIRSSFPENIHFRLDVEGQLCPVQGDSTQILQVLLNLCVNARDAMRDGGTLTLSAANVEVDASYASAIPGAIPGSYVMWRISDTGIGIPMEMLDRIYEPFFTTKAQGKGTGLGLSIVVGIVKSHHGFLNVYSTPNKGSTFSIYLPADQSGSVDTIAPVVIRDAFVGKGESILVVDDSEGMRAAALSVLDALNLHVITAMDGNEALEIVGLIGEKLSAIITDVHMPNMDGLTFVRQVRNILPDIGIIVISGNLDEEEAGRFMKKGVQTFLKKPFTQENLTSALTQVLSK